MKPIYVGLTWLVCFSTAFSSVPVKNISNLNTVSAPKQIDQWGTGEAVSISYSNDGSLLAVGTSAGYILIYDTNEYQLISTIETDMILGFFGDSFENGFGGTGSIDISPDNQIVGVVAVDGSIGLWNILDGKSRFIKWGSGNGQFQHTGDVDLEKHGYFLGEGEIFAVRSSYYNDFRFFRTEDGMELAIGLLPINPYFEPDTSPDLRFIVGTLDSRRWIYKRTLDWLQWTDVRSIWNDTWGGGGYSKDGQYAIRKSANTAAVWNVAEKTNLFSVSAPDVLQEYSRVDETVWTQSPIFSRDGQTLLLFWPYHFSETYLVSVWNISQKEKMGEFSIADHPSDAVAVTSTGERMAYAVPGGVEIVDLPAGNIIKTLIIGTCAGQIKLSPNGQFIASFLSQFIYICESENGKLLRTINVPTGYITDIDWAPDSLHLASSGNHARNYYVSSGINDSKIHIWDISTGQQVNSIAHESGDAVQVQFSPDGMTIASVNLSPGNRPCGIVGSGDSIFLQQASDGKVLTRARPLIGMVTKIDFTPDGLNLVIASSRPCASGSIVYFINMKGVATKVADGFSFHVLPNGDLITLAYQNSLIVQKWDIKSVSPKLLTTTDFGPIDSGNSINIDTFSPDGEQLIFTHRISGPQGQSGQQDIYWKANLESTINVPLLQNKGDYWFPPASVIFSQDGDLVLISPGELAGIIKVFQLSP